jgi:hypothetical protein
VAWRSRTLRGEHVWRPWLLGLILAVGAALRLYGLNWDGGHWLQPDERQIYFIALGLHWPSSLAEALSPASPLNPGFFAYGSLPIYLVRLFAALLAPLWPVLGNPDNLHVAGRLLAAAFDLGTVYLSYRLVCQIGADPWHPEPVREHDAGQVGSEQIRQPAAPWLALVAAALVSLATIHVQLAHFYTADPLLVFFVMFTLSLALDVVHGAGKWRQMALGVALGLALATKISATPLVLIPIVAHRNAPVNADVSAVPSARRLVNHYPSLRHLALTLLIAAAVFSVTQPYVLIDLSTFMAHSLRESQIAWGRFDVPYTLQYAGTWPYLYPAWQLALWGLALPVGLAAWTGLALLLAGWLRRGGWAAALILAWVGAYFAVTGLLHAKPMRYMLPLVPVLCALAAGLPTYLEWQGSRDRVGRWLAVTAYATLLASSLIYALLYVRIYAEPHSWITASAWIYRHVPGGSTLAVEHWDTTLPLPLEVDGQERRIGEYDVRVLDLYDEPDNPEKWERVAADLAESDYVIIASRRLYGSITNLPDRYPLATGYYEQLFAGELGFELVGEFVRGPAWLNPRVPPLPGAAPMLLRPDESFVVYDHPRALIFRNTRHLPVEELLRRVGVS